MLVCVCVFVCVVIKARLIIHECRLKEEEEGDDGRWMMVMEEEQVVKMWRNANGYMNKCKICSDLLI